MPVFLSSKKLSETGKGSVSLDSMVYTDNILFIIHSDFPNTACYPSASGDTAVGSHQVPVGQVQLQPAPDIINTAVPGHTSHHS